MDDITLDCLFPGIAYSFVQISSVFLQWMSMGSINYLFTDILQIIC